MNAIRINLMHIEHNCNIVKFLMDIPTKLYCFFTSIIDEGFASDFTYLQNTVSFV